MTLKETLLSTSNYPIAEAVVDAAALLRGLDTQLEADPCSIASPEYKATLSDIYRFLASAPNVSEGGVSFSFSAEERRYFLRLSDYFLQQSAADTATFGSGFGYQGTDF